MTTMGKVTAKWSGFSGGPGYSNFFFALPQDGMFQPQDASDATGSVWAFFTQLATLLPPTVKINVQGDVEMIQSSNGELINVIGQGPREQITGSAVDSPYSAASGAVVTWRTGGVRNGRRVRGRTFLVPIANVAYATDGTLNPGAINTLQTAATNMIGNTGVGELGVWSRPSSVGATDGAWFSCTAATVPDLGAILKSRRD